MKLKIKLFILVIIAVLVNSASIGGNESEENNSAEESSNENHSLEDDISHSLHYEDDIKALFKEIKGKITKSMKNAKRQASKNINELQEDKKYGLKKLDDDFKKNQDKLSSISNPECTKERQFIVLTEKLNSCFKKEDPGSVQFILLKAIKELNKLEEKYKHAKYLADQDCKRIGSFYRTQFCERKKVKDVERVRNEIENGIKVIDDSVKKENKDHVKSVESCRKYVIKSQEKINKEVIKKAGLCAIFGQPKRNPQYSSEISDSSSSAGSSNESNQGQNEGVSNANPKIVQEPEPSEGNLAERNQEVSDVTGGSNIIREQNIKSSSVIKESIVSGNKPINTDGQSNRVKIPIVTGSTNMEDPSENEINGSQDKKNSNVVNGQNKNDSIGKRKEATEILNLAEITIVNESLNREELSGTEENTSVIPKDASLIENEAQNVEATTTTESLISTVLSNEKSEISKAARKPSVTESSNKKIEERATPTFTSLRNDGNLNYKEEQESEPSKASGDPGVNDLSDGKHVKGTEEQVSENLSKVIHQDGNLSEKEEHKDGVTNATGESSITESTTGNARVTEATVTALRDDGNMSEKERQNVKRSEGETSEKSYVADGPMVNGLLNEESFSGKKGRNGGISNVTETIIPVSVENSLNNADRKNSESSKVTNEPPSKINSNVTNEPTSKISSKVTKDPVFTELPNKGNEGQNTEIIAEGPIVTTSFNGKTEASEKPNVAGNPTITESPNKENSSGTKGETGTTSTVTEGPILTGSSDGNNLEVVQGPANVSEGAIFSPNEQTDEILNITEESTVRGSRTTEEQKVGSSKSSEKQDVTELPVTITIITTRQNSSIAEEPTVTELSNGQDPSATKKTVGESVVPVFKRESPSGIETQTSKSIDVTLRQNSESTNVTEELIVSAQAANEENIEEAEGRKTDDRNINGSLDVTESIAAKEQSGVNPSVTERPIMTDSLNVESSSATVEQTSNKPLVDEGFIVTKLFNLIKSNEIGKQSSKSSNITKTPDIKDSYITENKNNESTNLIERSVNTGTTQSAESPRATEIPTSESPLDYTRVSGEPNNETSDVITAEILSELVDISETETSKPTEEPIGTTTVVANGSERQTNEPSSLKPYIEESRIKSLNEPLALNEPIETYVLPQLPQDFYQSIFDQYHENGENPQHIY